MREIRMEILSESEGLEICRDRGYRFVKTYMGKGSNHGRLMMLAIDESISTFGNRQIAFDIREELEDTLIFAHTIHGKMYIADRKKTTYPTTFNEANAKKFKYSAAVKKAAMMRKRGTYDWRTFKVK